MGAPVGWPQEVPPPEVEGWERAACAYLYDLCPAEHRAEPLLARHPVLLARVAGNHVGAAVEALRKAYGRARYELKDVLEASQIEEAVAFYEREGKRLVTAQRAVELIEQALRGTRFTTKLEQR